MKKEQKEPQQINQILPTQAKAPESGEEPEILSEEEIRHVLEVARRAKRAELKTIEYNRRIRQEQEEISVSKDKFFEWICWKAKSLNPEEGGVREFKLSETEERIYKLLSMYFTKDLGFTEEKDPWGQNYSLHKGLWFFGQWGCGKSTIMELFSNNPLATYPVVSCEEIANTYRGKGTIASYEQLKSVCLDDLGKDLRDGVPMYMGTKKNVLAHIIAAIYKANKSKVFRTHVTTNCDLNQVEELYGGDIKNRLKEMMNIISLDGIESKR